MTRLASLVAAVVLLVVGYNLRRPYQRIVDDCRVEVVPGPRPQVKVPLAEHTYANGLLVVNPDGRHPIFDLIARAELDWKEKQRRASRTLGEAVKEYRKRYRRDPPKGFDKWWEYVQRHNVQLPDEYDQIHRDLEPYWGMDPADLQDLHAELEATKTDFSVLSNSRRSGLRVTIHGSESRTALDVKEMLSEVQDHLPPFRAIISHDDRPNRLRDFGIEDALLEAAATETVLSAKHLPRATHSGWRSACHPKSRANQISFDLDGPPPPKPPKTFIYDHLLSMDPCVHPALLWSHGQFLSHNEGPSPHAAMIPEFSFCATTLHHDISVPTLYGWVDDETLSHVPAWDEKVDERLVWRGTNTGITYAEDTRWKGSQRTVLLEKTNSIPGSIDVLKSTPEDQPVGPAESVKNAYVNPAMFDVGFVEVSNCGTVCAHLLAMSPLRNRHSRDDAWQYKYIIDVDGNGWSGRFKQLMSSKSLVFKSTVYPEWFLDRVQPWVHYVPVQVDLSDLHDALVFFRGGLDGVGRHDDLARKIALEGNAWKDMIAYLFRLFLEYSRVMNVNRKEMFFAL
ncbi:glycosyl transferase family 90-domain-containing protein [Mucidula mucida]|nr:glycosyl transferase family 90-domain-containing protein [Mucidula mucida]